MKYLLRLDCIQLVLAQRCLVTTPHPGVEKGILRLSYPAPPRGQRKYLLEYHCRFIRDLTRIPPPSDTCTTQTKPLRPSRCPPLRSSRACRSWARPLDSTLASRPIPGGTGSSPQTSLGDGHRSFRHPSACTGLSGLPPAVARTPPRPLCFLPYDTYVDCDGSAVVKWKGLDPRGVP